jgi:DHA1 family bicyclomycin/chloramphenicol resistance-like MFS transporter
MKHPFTKGMTLLTIILMDMLWGAEIDLFVPSFPELQSQFNLSPFWVEALLSVNFIGYCLSLFFVGILSDRYGRKPIILVGLVTFIIGSIVCLYGTSYKFLLIGRFFQGVGVAAPAILGFLIIADSYPLKHQQYLLGVLNGVMNISIAIAPVVGSYITIYFHWQGNFMALLILAAMTLVMTAFFVPAHKLPENREPISLSGYASIFRSKPLMLMMTHLVFLFSFWGIFVGIAPLLYVKDLGVSLAHFGYYQGALALVFAVGSVLSGMIVSKYDQKKMLSIANLICLAGLVTVALGASLYARDPFLIALALLPFIVGQILPTTIINPLCVNFISKAKGRISAIIQGVRLILMAIGLELAGYYYRGSFRNIGIILGCVIVVSVVTLFFIVRNRELMQRLPRY